MRFLILNTDYAEFLDTLYTSHPALKTQSYDHQMRIRNESLFGVADFYSSNLRRHGHEAWEIYPNNEFMQKAWAREHGIPAGSRWRWSELGRSILPFVSQRPNHWSSQILSKQIAHYRPDVLLNQALDEVRADFLHEQKSNIRLLVGQHASPLPEGQDLRCYDLLISSLPNLVDHFRHLGIAAELHRLGFEPRVLTRVTSRLPQIPVSFVGSISTAHESRVRLLEDVCARCGVEVWGLGADTLPTSTCLRRQHRGRAWGLDMYQILRDSKITLNHHIDMANGYANNMRLFEATGVGTLLLTDWKVNLQDMFEPGREVITYRTPQECAELIDYYIGHDAERDAVAHAGQQRTLREHSYDLRMQELVDVVASHL
jgi:spore maturation protein CgeB